MRWVALQPKGGNYFRGNLFVQPATQGMSEMLSYWVKTLFKKPFPRLCLHFLFMKTVLFPDLGVCWYTLSLSFHLQYISRAHLSPEIIFSHVSHFNVLTIQFSKKKAEREHTFHPKHFDQKGIFHGSAFYEVDIWLMRDLSRQKSHCCTFNYCKNIRMQKGLHWSQLMSKYSLEVGLRSHNVGVGRLHSGQIFIPSQDALEVMLGTQWLNNAEGF